MDDKETTVLNEVVDSASEDIYRSDDVTVRAPEPLSPELQVLLDERTALKAARDQALSATSAPVVQPVVAPITPALVDSSTQVLPVAEPPVPTTQSLPNPKDKSLGRKPNDWVGASFGLLAARWVTAFIFGVHGMNSITHIGDTQGFFAKTILPSPDILAWVVSVAELAIAVALVFGLLTRLAGLGVLLIAGGSLVFYYWGMWSIFVEGKPGFLGEFELVLAAMGLVFVFLGGGGWSLDRSFRVGRARDKAEQALARSQR